MKTGFVWTDFQKRAATSISKVVAEHHRTINLIESGEKEIYLEGLIDPGALKLWIYEDELELRGEQFHLLLEKPDFDSLDEMLEYFITQLTEKLKQQA